MLTIEAVIEFINGLEDIKALDKIRTVANDRQKSIFKAIQEKRHAEAWERVRHRDPGDVLYCNMSGTMIGGLGIQRGDRVKIYSIQPRKKLLWITLANKKTYGLRPAMIHKYDLRFTKPEKPISDYDRKMAEGMGKVLANVL